MSKDIELSKTRTDHRTSMQQFRKFNAKRKVKQAVLAHLAAKKMSHFVGLGVDQTFMFTQGKTVLSGVEPMNTTSV
jgi:hypothetical protein